MLLTDLLTICGKGAPTKALLRLMDKRTARRSCIEGLTASSLALYYAAATMLRAAKGSKDNPNNADTATAKGSKADINSTNAGTAKGDTSTVFIMRDADEAGYLYQDLCRMLGEEGILYFPSSYKRAVKFGQRDTSGEMLRTETLTTINNLRGASCTIVTYPAALAEMVISQTELDDRQISLSKGQTIPITDVEHQLRELGFAERDYVYEPGQFAVRGSIIDVYSFSSEDPYRIDFFDDDIDTIRTFDVESQLSKEMLEAVTIVPHLDTTATEKVPLLELLPSDSLIITPDMGFATDAINYIYKEGYSQQAMSDRLSNATEMEKADIMRELNAERNLCPASRFSQQASQMRWIELRASASADCSITFHTLPQPLFHKNFDLLAQTLFDYHARGYRCYIVSDSTKQHERLAEIFNGIKIGDGCVSDFLNDWRISGSLHEGFIDDDMKMLLFTDHQIFERFHKYQLKAQSAKRGKMALTLKELQEMEPGDFIVHVDFGIGKFGGLVRIPGTNGSNDFQEVIRIIYAKGDKVDVSIHSLYKISKYRRSDTGEPPRLSTLGTGAWDRIKERAKKRIKDIARDLIKLYAKRRHEKGFAFSPDTYLQHELEGSFLYEDTPDQMKATQEVKHDMEQARPMDRLVCGDVGFGKTEVAVRAAFKAACDNKQVAVLVPTTVLAFQHYKTFSKRLDGLPVTVDYLTRARTAKQTKELLEKLENGRIDILVGTHRMLTKAVKWKDLGLLIIDEEQKFGVSTKEKLRQLKTNVDTLTMSATPIPRTLQFSLMGARDMSIMRTPPPNRQPIDTMVATFSPELISDAINFEMSRDGQVYFVCHRIATLEKMRTIIERHVPDCRIAIGHGQMKPEELEKIIIGFINHDYDVLLSTTIVENGIDIPNANTIIISDANHFGLSDLHQMRGRVGRSNRKAFCYLLAPPLAYLPTESRRRLEALETFADLGSGFNLAMQDLDIRGAGNLLGAEQSGFMEDLGYETYQKILSQAVNELKNDEFQDLYKEQIEEGENLTGEDFVDDCNIDSDLQMYFPDYYVPGSSERMLLYRELDSIHTDADLQAYRKRMEDRFGPVPPEGEELMMVVLLRRLGRRLGCERLILKQHQLQMQFVTNENSMFYKSKFFESILAYVQSHPKLCDFKVIGGHNRLIIKNIPTAAAATKVLKECIMQNAN